MQPSASTTSSSETVVRILVLGGNGMMGSDFVYRVRNTLEKKHAGTHRFEITTLNRGNHYWDSEDRVENILDKKIICGRKELKHCGQEVFGSSGKVFDFVVDFSGYKKKYVKYVLDKIQVQKLYIFISTDSVYEVCKPMTKTPILEEAAVRPDDRSLRDMLNEADNYGNDKLKCEEYLQARRASKSHLVHSAQGDYSTERALNYLILRLPDVIGPRDNTDRFFNYFLWLRTHKDSGIPLHLNQTKGKRLSFVHCSTVAAVICESIDITLPGASIDFNGEIKHKIKNRVFNLADGVDEGIPLKEFLTLMGKAMGIPEVTFKEGACEEINTYYPSTTRGPISSKKAARAFPMYSPKNMYDVLKESVMFYDRVMSLWVNNKCNKVIKEQIEEIVHDDLVQELEMSKIQRTNFWNSLRRYYACD
jgi:nucleoside-diphosphate-sugar epimerase